MDFSDDVHSFNHATKHGEFLDVGIAFPSEIELGLIANADKEIGSRSVNSSASHRERPVDMAEPGCVGAFKLKGEPSFFPRPWDLLHPG
jgi:hypothetical protein